MEEKEILKEAKFFLRAKSNYETASLEMEMKHMAQSGFGFWKILLILTIALAVLLFAAFTAPVVNVATIYVPDDQGTIQEAVDAATPGDTIH